MALGTRAKILSVMQRKNKLNSVSRSSLGLREIGSDQESIDASLSDRIINQSDQEIYPYAVAKDLSVELLNGKLPKIPGIHLRNISLPQNS